MLNFLEKKYYTFYKKINSTNNIKYYTPILNEWNNNIYNYNKHKILKNIYLKDSLIYKLFKSYFNIKKITLLKSKKFSIITVFIGKQYISHINNKIYITLCVYNKDKVYFKKFIFNLYKEIFLLQRNKKIIKIKKIFSFFNRSFFNVSTKNNNYINLILKYKKLYILIVKYLLKRYRRLFFFKKRIIKLKFMNYKYNVNNFLGIKNILYKIYNKEIEFNIINLKYLYLDSNILNEAVGAKLKNRENNLLKNIMKSIALVKIPYRARYNKINNLYNFSNIILFLNPSLHNKDIGLIKEFMYVSTQKMSIALFNLRYKLMIGIKVQGAGRLTKRLTALRSVSKIRQKGSLENIYSSYYSISSIMLLGYLKSNLQYIKKNYNNRNGSYGIKTHISTI